MKRYVLTYTLFLLAVGVALGAFGAHALKHQLSATALQNWHTAVNYQFWHGLGAGLLWLIASQRPAFERFYLSALLLLIGTTLFSGSLYLHSLSGWKPLVYLTPIGGSLMLVGWFWAAYWAWRARD
ncbi:MAG: DUF423 domain-containing protein [Aquaspirillum sp.]